MGLGSIRFRTHRGNVRLTLGLYRDNGQFCGNYYLGFRVWRFMGLIGKY